MITKSDLKEYVGLKEDVEQLKWEIAEMETIIESASIQQLTGMPTAHNAVSKLEIDALALMERKDYYADLLARFTSQRKYVDWHIERLPQTERQLIKYKYIQGNTWEKVCVLMNYSWKHVHRIHGNALQHLEKMTYNDTIKDDII